MVVLASYPRLHLLLGPCLGKDRHNTNFAPQHGGRVHGSLTRHSHASEIWEIKREILLVQPVIGKVKLSMIDIHVAYIPKVRLVPFFPQNLPRSLVAFLVVGPGALDLGPILSRLGG